MWRIRRIRLGKEDEILNRIVRVASFQVTFEHGLEAGEGVSHANI